ncbi:protocadherin Fat 4-like isoform X5 [Homarus americanus]|uniref:protocadherin Fat 4-like isoform X5 n=1 Tax=Homarus americanus TaxID=6706 RepID=UPI001C46F1E1|nr:protocadherin Fat 4-like isoform X5 [Homarus americanus]
MRTKAWGAPTATHSRQQVPARTLGVMASTRGQFRPFSYKTQAVATIFIIFITVSSSAAQDDCYSHINVSEGHELEGISPNLILRVNVEETTPKDTPLYALTVDEDVTMTLPVDENFIKYFSMDKITEKLSIGVKTSLIGVPDYPINTKSIIGTVTFGDFSGGIKDCTVQMSHSILDENTKAPEFTQNTYTLNIREDYPVQLEIYNLEVQASDNDGDSPNNMFTVSVEDCPLEATGEYGGVAGKPYNIKFTLKSPLDFEKTKKYTCTIIAKDKGATSLSSDSATISITVIDMPDEAPVFTSDFYSADVDSSSPSDDALVTVPEPISATDGDKDINSPITYTMKDARSDIPGTNYFSIDEKTGEVRVTRELDQDILVNVWVSFIITATDNTTASSSVTLDVELPWFGHYDNDLHFELYRYATVVLGPTKNEVVLRVRAVTNTTYEVIYTLNEPSTHFAINNNGEITVLDDDLKPDTYNLIAVATVDDPPLKDKAKVNIKVLPSSINVMMTNSLLTAKVEERSSEQALVNVTTSGDTGTVCITDVQPKTAEGKFDIQGKGNDWAVIMKEMLNFDVEHQEIKLKLEAYEDVINCSPIGTTGDELLRNQALVVITVLDINDQKPYFIVPNSDMKVIAYPNDKALQSVVGPVITLQAKDDDTVGVLTYGLVQSNGGFTVEKETGAVYVEGQFDCSSKCDLHVKVTDGKANTEASIKAISVDMTHIYTLTLNDLDVTEVDDYLKTISKESSVQVSKLYVSPIMDTVRSQRARTRRTIRKRDTSEEGRTLQVHVYGIDKDGELMTLDDLNKALSQGHTNVKAQTFSDKEVFQGGGTVITPDTGLKVAVGILGAIVGLAVVAIVGYFAYQRYPRKPEARMTKRASSPIPTLGQAYPNLSYSEEIEGKDESPGSTGHKTNGSVNSTSNGYSHRESPPLFRSNLSSHSSDPHNSISKSEQQQRGLRRVDPGSPEYYGLSSPAPPPSFSTNDNTTTTGSTSTTTTTTTSSPPDTFSTASSSSSTKPPAPNLYPTLETIQEQSPIYAMINKPPKKEPPSIPTTPAKSILKSSGEPSDHMSTTALPPTQPSVPDADYDEIDNVPPASRFSHLKGSPPPRKHSLPIDDDDDEGDDETGTENGQKVTYPGGKKSNLKQEGAEGSDDEKKSVAFKVLVDTKEIVAENPGAAQKAAAVKSNAIEMMMANKKKIEEDEDEDEDERL